MSNEPAPAGLAESGEMVWSSIVSKYDLRPDELRTLEDICAATDMIALLDKQWRDEGMPMRAKGSTGQPVIDPLIGEIRAQRAARNALWRQLKLPDLDAPSEPVNQNRDAANASWQPGVRGRGA